MADYIYATGITDSRGNSYTPLPDFRTDAHPLADKYNTGVRLEGFWCQSSLGTVNQIITTFSGRTLRRAMMCYRFRNHSGAPFQVRTYGNYDEVAFATDRVEATGTLPTWTFTNPNGRVFCCAIGSLQPDMRESNLGDTYRFAHLGGFGLGQTEILSISMNTAMASSGLISGTSSNIQPGFRTYAFTGGAAVTNIWRAIFAFGMNPAPTFSIPALILAGDTFTFGNGFSANYTLRHGGNNDNRNQMSATVSIVSNGNPTSPGFCDTVQAGDGILVVAGCPQVNDQGYMSLSAVV